MKMRQAKIICAVLVVSISSGVHAEQTEARLVHGNAYAAARVLNGQIDDARATLHEPGVFDGKTTVRFGRSTGFGLAGGVLGASNNYLFGLELEWLVNSSEIEEPLPSDYFDLANSFEQMSFNLNAVTGIQLLGRFMPYAIGGIGYTEVTFQGRNGLATVSRGDESWDSTFGYHAGGGMQVKLYGKFYLDLGGRYYATTDPRFGNSETWVEIPNSGYMLHIGLAYNSRFEVDMDHPETARWCIP